MLAILAHPETGTPREIAALSDCSLSIPTQILRIMDGEFRESVKNLTASLGKFDRFLARMKARGCTEAAISAVVRNRAAVVARIEELNASNSR